MYAQGLHKGPFLSAYRKHIPLHSKGQRQQWAVLHLYERTLIYLYGVYGCHRVYVRLTKCNRTSTGLVSQVRAKRNSGIVTCKFQGIRLSSLGWKNLSAVPTFVCINMFFIVMSGRCVEVKCQLSVSFFVGLCPVNVCLWMWLSFVFCFFNCKFISRLGLVTSHRRDWGRGRDREFDKEIEKGREMIVLWLPENWFYGSPKPHRVAPLTKSGPAYPKRSPMPILLCDISVAKATIAARHLHLLAY